MSGCGCNTKTSSGAKKGVNYQTGNNDYDVEGSFIGGAGVLICNIARTVSVTAIEAPNKLIFASNPCLGLGDKLKLNNLELATCMTGMTPCQTVIAAPVKVGETYVVATDGNWASSSGSNRLDLISSISSSIFCGETTTTGKALTIEVCGATPALSDFNGYVYTRPLNSPPSIGAVFVSNGSSQLIVKSSSFGGKVGDRVELEQTDVNGNNAAIIQSIASGRNSNGDVITTIRLNKPVSGVTAAVATGATLPCVTATSRPAPIAQFTFQPKCGCCVNATVDKSVTSNQNFPLGKKVDDGGSCGVYEYCYVINIGMPGSDVNFISGKLQLV
jgi:hypothetical protein